MIPVPVEQTIVSVLGELFPEVFVVDITLTLGQRNALVIKLDTDQGITLDTCAHISRKLGKALETLPELDMTYTLEVSSPGVGYPLKLRRQYVQNLGRNLKVTLLDHTKISGKITEVLDEGVMLEMLPVATVKNKPQKASGDPSPTRLVRWEDLKEAKIFI
ncbi:MAG: ribosome maturation factor RimP [Bacteroidia bacterium]|nr:ribosome maturation factor RimP [Bacteroidia bacterium]